MSNQPQRIKVNEANASELFGLSAITIPYSEEAERAVLGAVLINPPSYNDIADRIEADDFYLLRHAYIWQAMMTIQEAGEVLDNLTLAETLRRAGQLGDIGGPAYITQLINSTPSSVHTVAYAEIVRRASNRRQLLMKADEIKALALDESKHWERTSTEAEALLFQVTGRSQQSEPEHISDLLIEYQSDLLERIESQRELGIPSGFKDFDKRIGGFYREEFVTLAAPPGMGKTSLALNLAANQGRLGVRVAFISGEMPKQQLIQRMIAIEAKLNIRALRDAQISRDSTAQDRHKLREAASRMSEWPVHFVYENELTPMHLKRTIRRLYNQNGLDIVYIDGGWLFSMGESWRGNSLQEINAVLREMQDWPKQLNIPIVVIHQMNREIFMRAYKRPVLADLKNSGMWEAVSSKVIFLHRAEYWDEATEFPNYADVIVAKHRDGELGTFTLHFEKSHTAFHDPKFTNIHLGNYGGATHAAHTHDNE